MTSRVLLDCANIHTGGGVQVAASVLDEWRELYNSPITRALYPWMSKLCIRASTEVADSVRSGSLDVFHTEIFDRLPLSARDHHSPSKFDVALYVFGPHYHRLDAPLTISGYADITSIAKRPVGVPPASLKNRLKSSVRGALSRNLVARHTIITVETDAAKTLLASRVRNIEHKIRVAPNAYNSIFDSESEWAPPLSLTWHEAKPDVVFTYITRPYPHKNLKFIGEFIEALRPLGLKAKCLLTVPDSMWESIDELTRIHSVNLGTVQMNAVPRVYQLADTALFPSLLEAFSVMPLEAMRIGLPVVASDRDFVRTTCGDAPIYVDPLDPRGAASTFAKEYFQSTLAERGRVGQTHVKGLPTAIDRARQYADLVNELLER